MIVLTISTRFILAIQLDHVLVVVDVFRVERACKEHRVEIFAQLQLLSDAKRARAHISLLLNVLLRLFVLVTALEHLQVFL